MILRKLTIQCKIGRGRQTTFLSITSVEIEVYWCDTSKFALLLYNAAMWLRFGDAV